MYLPANLRNMLWFRFQPGHRYTSFCARSQPSHDIPDGDTGRKDSTHRELNYLLQSKYFNVFAYSSVTFNRSAQNLKVFIIEYPSNNVIRHKIVNNSEATMPTGAMP